MDRTGYLAAISREAESLVAAATAAAAEARVPSCPDWTVADLLAHVGRVHRWAARTVEVRAQERVPFGAIEAAPEPDARTTWVRAGAARLVEVLSAAAPDDAVWTLVGPGTVAFWDRRQACETVVHRVDAQLAAGTVEPVEPALAADAIDELLTLVRLAPRGSPSDGGGNTLHLASTDHPRDWVVRSRADGGVDVESAAAPADVTLRGPASDLLLLLTGRGPGATVEQVGDAGVVGGFLARLTR